MVMWCIPQLWAFQVAQGVKNPPAVQTGGASSVPRSERSSGEGNGNPLQHSCLENPMGNGAWQAIVYRVAKSWTQLKQLSKEDLLYPNILYFNIALGLFILQVYSKIIPKT